MKVSNSMNFFWFGFGVGAATAAILAPKSGADTRDYLQIKAAKTSDALKHQVQDLRQRAIQSLEQGKEEYQHHLRKFSAAMDAGKKAFVKA